MRQPVAKESSAESKQVIVKERELVWDLTTISYIYFVVHYGEALEEKVLLSNLLILHFKISPCSSQISWIPKGEGGRNTCVFILVVLCLSPLES